MEVTMLQSEEMLAQESKARQSAENTLTELESMYAHLEAEHDNKQQQVLALQGRLDVLVRALAEETESRRDDEQNAA